MSLHLSYRPDDFDEFLGSETTIKALKSKLNSEEKPHSYLITGPSGCGKTTLGRIIAKRVGALLDDEDPLNSRNYKEMDSADFRGIDTVRNIRQQIRMSPIGGAESRAWLLDECFDKNTLVNTPNGDIQIKNISVGDVVYSLAGKDTVINTFQNKIDISRVCKLKFNNGKTVYCSDSHEFFTKEGWKFAKDLKNSDFIFSLDRSIFSKMELNAVLPEKTNENKKTLQVLRKTNSILSQSTRKIQQKILQSEMPGAPQTDSLRNTREVIQFRNQKKNIQKEKRILSNHERKISKKEGFRKNDFGESHEISKKHTKNERDEKNKRDSSHMDRKKRREWSIDGTSKNLISGDRLGIRSGNKFRTKEKRISNQLQSRFREPEPENSNRNRWGIPSHEKKYSKRFKENENAEFIRLESFQIYQSGNNEKSFESVIGFEEKNKGFVIFYDLEIKNHASYFVNNACVHNCHQLTKDAQEALLKALEDTPSHVYFILATTEPGKLKDTLKRRCQHFQVSHFSEDLMEEFLKDVVESEEKKVPNDIIGQITDNAAGSPGKALIILDKIIDLAHKDMKEEVESISRQLNQAIDLCRAIINKEKWTKVAKILKDLQKEDAEGLRRMVLKYCSSILLKKEDSRAYLIMDAFRDPFYDSPYEKLILACYESLYAE